MRDETAEWLNPMFEEVDRRGDIDILPLMTQSSMPAAEAATPFIDWMPKNVGDVPGVEHRAIDWVRFGQLLRLMLGWDDTYPAYPDFPEARDVP
jgi:hypothetical protein